MTLKELKNMLAQAYMTGVLVGIVITIITLKLLKW